MVEGYCNNLSRVWCFRKFRYQSEWDEEFVSETDVDIVIEGEILPVHSVMLCQSSILRTAVRKTRNSGRLRLESGFRGVSVEDMDLLLAHVYPSSNVHASLDLHECGSVLPLAIKFGFHVVEKRILNVLSMRKETMPEELSVDDPCAVQNWIRLAMETACPSLTSVIAKFLARHYHTILGPNREEVWDGVSAILNTKGWRAVAGCLGSMLDVEGNRTILLEYRCPNCDHCFEEKECTMSELLEQKRVYGGAQFMCQSCGNYINCAVNIRKKLHMRTNRMVNI